jgi:hypothetical protein
MTDQQVADGFGIDETVADPRDVALQNAAQRDVLFHAQEVGKTKPSRDLSSRQRAAARFLARGDRTIAVARRLKIHRGTISRWQQSELFQRELDRLHDLFAKHAARALGRSSGGVLNERRPRSMRARRDSEGSVDSVISKILADVEEQRAAARKRFAQLSTPRHRS